MNALCNLVWKYPYPRGYSFPRFSNSVNIYIISFGREHMGGYLLPLYIAITCDRRAGFRDVMLKFKVFASMKYDKSWQKVICRFSNRCLFAYGGDSFVDPDLQSTDALMRYCRCNINRVFCVQRNRMMRCRSVLQPSDPSSYA